MGEVQELKPPASSWHAKLLAVSLELKLKLALLELEGFEGWLVIVVLGAAVSITHV